MSHIFKQIDRTSPLDKGAIEQISRWSAEYKTMKFYETIELEQHPLAILAMDEDIDEGFITELLGHVAITEISEINQQRCARIGALVVNGNYKSNGIAKELVAQLMEIAPKALALLEIERYYAYVHQESLNSFLANGAEIIGRRNPVPATGCDIIVSLVPEN